MKTLFRSKIKVDVVAKYMNHTDRLDSEVVHDKTHNEDIDKSRNRSNISVYV